MCIWNVAEQDRMCEFCSYQQGCEVRPKLPSEALAERYLEAMNRLVGEDVRQKCRRRELVWGRNLVAYKLSEMGMTQEKIAGELGIMRSSVVHSLKQVKLMLSTPKAYPDEMVMWRRFNYLLSA